MTPKTAVRTRNDSVQDAPLTSHKEINEAGELLSDIILRIVKEELAAHEQTIKVLLNSNLQAPNERLDKIATEMDELSVILQYTQSQLDEKLGSVKKDTIKLEIT